MDVQPPAAVVAAQQSGEQGVAPAYGAPGHRPAAVGVVGDQPLVKQLCRRVVGCHQPACEESLFVVWSFDGAEPLTIEGNLAGALRDVPPDECPDLVRPAFLIADPIWSLALLDRPREPQ